MKCLDKKRIKLKQGETLALNERVMLSMVSLQHTNHVGYIFYYIYLYCCLLMARKALQLAGCHYIH